MAEIKYEVVQRIAEAASDIRKTVRSAKGSPVRGDGARSVTEGVNHKAPLPAGEPVLLPPPGHPVRAGGCFVSAQC